MMDPDSCSMTPPSTPLDQFEGMDVDIPPASQDQLQLQLHLCEGTNIQGFT